MERFVGTEDALTDGMIKVFYQVYNELGCGFLEAVYARAMGLALEQAGFSVASEVAIPVLFVVNSLVLTVPTWSSTEKYCWNSRPRIRYRRPTKLN